MSDSVRTFIIRTLLQDDVTRGLDTIRAKQQAIASKAVEIVTKVTDSSKSVQAMGDVERQSKSMAGAIDTVAAKSKAAGNSISDLFNKIDAGRLIVGAGAVALAAYADSVVKTYESYKLNIDMIKDQLGASSSGLRDYISAGGQTSGTSESGRAGIISYMAMTGYKDEKRMQEIASNAEKIMHSKFGKGLAQFGISSEKDLLQSLSGRLDETSDLGRIIKSKMPEFFKASTLQTEIIKVGQEKNFAFQSSEVIEAEARRRLMARALKAIGKDATPDNDSYRRSVDDMVEATDNFRKKIGETLEPAATIITNFITTVMKMGSAHPSVTAMAGAVVVLGTGLSILGAVLPFVATGIKATTAALLTNPFILAAAAIVALVLAMVALESRFHIFSQAWVRFSQSQIGKDVIEGVKTLLGYLGLLGQGDYFSGIIAKGEAFSKWISNIFDQIDAVYKMLKGGDIAGALAGAIKVSLQLSPMGFATAFAEGQLPLKRVQDEALDILKKLKDIWDGFTRWLSSIYDSLQAGWDSITTPLKDLKEYLTALLSKIPGLNLFGGGGAVATEPIVIDNSSKQWKKAEWDQMQSDLSTLSVEDFAKKWHFSKEGAPTASRTINTGEQLPGGAPSVSEGAKTIITTIASIPTNIEKGKEIEAQKYESGTDKEEEQWIQDKLGSAAGGQVTKTGFELVHEGEPIVPAEVARSSTLIDRLSEIASGGVGAIGSSGGIQIGAIHINLQGQQDAESIAREVKDKLAAELSDFEFGNRTERFVHRANRAYIA